MKSPFGIRPKLTLIFLLFALGFVISISYVAYSSGRKSMEDATIHGLESISLEKQEALDKWIRDRINEISFFAADPRVIQHIETDLAAPAEDSPTEHTLIVNYLKNWVGSGQSFISILVVGPGEARVILSTNPAEEGSFRGDQLFYFYSRRTPYVHNIFYSLDLHQPAMMISSPIISADGKIIGAVAGYVNLDEINEIIQRRTGNQVTDDAFLVNSYLIATTQPRLAPIPFVLTQKIETTAVELCLAQATGSVYSEDYRGIPAIVFYRWMPENEMCLITKIDQSEALASINRLGQNILLMGVLMLALAFLLGYGLSISITQPILKINAGVKEIGKGNLEARVDSKSKDELGQLGQTFNDMAARIKSSHEQTLHNQKMLLSLSQAAQAVHQANSPAEIYKIIGDEIAKLDLQVFICRYDLEKKSLTLEYQTLVPGKINQDYRDPKHRKPLTFPLPLGSVFNMVIVNQSPVYISSLSTRMDIILGKAIISAKLKSPTQTAKNPAIFTPMIAEQKTLGMMIVEGQNLKETDIPAITIFTNQIVIALEKNRYSRESRELAEELENRVEERTLALQAAIGDLNASRVAALNIMEDAVEAGNQLEKTNVEMQIEIRERKKAEKKIRKLNVELEKRVNERTAQLASSNKELEAFSYSVSHDLRAPLRSMTGFSEALLEEYKTSFDPHTKDYLHRISEAAHRMGRLVDDLLRLSRITRTEINKVQMDLSVAAREIARELQSSNPERQVKWEIKPNLEVFADPELMQILLSNLLGNAWKFTGKQNQATIELSCKIVENQLIYYVRDNGAGFDPQYVSKLFTPFQRLHKREEYDGEGIGLSLVYRIIQRHGGTIWAEAKPDEGATFYFTFPSRYIGEKNEQKNNPAGGRQSR